MLTAADKKRVIKDLKKYERLFDQEDRRKRQELNQELLASRRRIAEEFYAILNRNKAVVQALKPMTVMIRGGYDEDDERNYVIETRVSCCMQVFVDNSTLMPLFHDEKIK